LGSIQLAIAVYDPAMNPVKKLLSYAESLRFPWLVLLTALIFVTDLFVPDVIPFVDEVLLGLLMVGLGRLRKIKKLPAD
jgi:hypothetical protein